MKTNSSRFQTPVEFIREMVAEYRAYSAKARQSNAPLSARLAERELAAKSIALSQVAMDALEQHPECPCALISALDFAPAVDGDYIVALRAGAIGAQVGQLSMRRFTKGVWMGGIRPFSKHSDVESWVHWHTANAASPVAVSPAGLEELRQEISHG